MASLSQITAQEAQEDIWTPEENFWRGQGPDRHVNRQGRKKYGLHKITHKGVRSDKVEFALDALRLGITRNFRKPINKNDYLELITQKNSSAIRPKIQNYTLHLHLDSIGSQPVLDRVVDIITDQLGSPMRTENDYLSWTTDSVKKTNNVIDNLGHLPDPEDIDAMPDQLDPKILYAPWIRRRDKKFRPIVDAHGKITHAARRFTFPESGLALSVRKAFKRPLEIAEFDSYVRSRSSTLREKFKDTADMFAGENLDLTKAVDAYSFFPLYQIPQERCMEISSRLGSAAPLEQPYILPQRVKPQFPQSFENLKKAFSNSMDLTLSEEQVTDFSSRHPMQISLLMQTMRELPPWYEDRTL